MMGSPTTVSRTANHKPITGRIGATSAAILGFGLVALLGVLVRPLLPIDETRYLAVAWEMRVTGDWLVPHLNGRDLWPQATAAFLADQSRVVHRRRLGCGGEADRTGIRDGDHRRDEPARPQAVSGRRRRGRPSRTGARRHRRLRGFCRPHDVRRDARPRHGVWRAGVDLCADVAGRMDRLRCGSGVRGDVQGAGDPPASSAAGAAYARMDEYRLAAHGVGALPGHSYRTGARRAVAGSGDHPGRRGISHRSPLDPERRSHGRVPSRISSRGGSFSRCCR